MSELATTLEARVNCPGCLAPLTYYDTVNSTHFACSQCHTLFRYADADEAPVKIKKFQDVPRLPPCLPPGSIGTLPDGLPYRVTGYSLRKEKSSAARWQEFMLFNPTAGYAQLALYEGHWTFIKPTTDKRTDSKKGKAGEARSVWDEDALYHLYNKYQPRILYAHGEFDWNMLDDERLTVQEYIAPPLMLVQETAVGQKPQWYRAEHIEPAAVAAAFGVALNQIPDRSGVGAVEPAPGGDTWPALRRFTLWMLALVLITEFGLGMARPRRPLLSEQFVSGASQPLPGARPDSTEKVLVSSSFAVTDEAVVLDFNLKADVSNSWLELPVSLVNEQTGQGFEFTKSIEYYYGVESGESWREGSVEATAVLHHVPAGRYHLNLYPVSENNRPVTFSVAVTANPWLASNFLLLTLALLLYPGVLYWRRIAHDAGRWEQSNYPAPTTT